MKNGKIEKRTDPALRRQRILLAALQVFAEKGFSAATIPEIAGLAGVAVGTIYLYYHNKRDLFVAVVENQIIAPLKGIFGSETVRDYQSTLRSAFLNRLELMQSNQLAGLVSLMSEIQRDPALKQMFVEKLVQPFMSSMEEYYAQQVDPAKPDQIEPALLVRIIGGIMIGMMVLKGLEGESSPLNQIPVNKAAEQILAFVINGITGQAG
jgi:AcrR family transcriptional regulator